MSLILAGLYSFMIAIVASDPAQFGTVGAGLSYGPTIAESGAALDAKNIGVKEPANQDGVFLRERLVGQSGGISFETDFLSLEQHLIVTAVDDVSEHEGARYFLAPAPDCKCNRFQHCGCFTEIDYGEGGYGAPAAIESDLGILDREDWPSHVNSSVGRFLSRVGLLFDRPISLVQFVPLKGGDSYVYESRERDDPGGALNAGRYPRFAGILFLIVGGCILRVALSKTHESARDSAIICSAWLLSAILIFHGTIWLLAGQWNPLKYPLV